MVRSVIGVRQHAVSESAVCITSSPPRHPACLSRPAQSSSLSVPVFPPPTLPVSFPPSVPIPVSPISGLRARETDLLPIPLCAADGFSHLILLTKKNLRPIILLRVFKAPAGQPAAARKGGGALVDVDKLHKFRVDRRVGEGGRAEQGSVDMLTLLLELEESSNFGLGHQLREHSEAGWHGEHEYHRLMYESRRGTRDRRTLRASSAFSGSSAGGRPQSASDIGVGCVTVRNTTSGSIPAKGSGDEDADLDRDLEGERARESVPVIGVGDGEAVRLRFLSGVRPRSASTLLSRSSRASRCRRWSSSLLRFLWPRSDRRGDLGWSGVRPRYKCRGLPRVSLRVVNR